jgi:membrane-associated protease RseP (regulator of RpoE activity)
MKRILLKMLCAALAVGLLMASVASAKDEAPRGASDNSKAPAQAYLGLGVTPLHPALVSQLPDVIGKGQGVLVEEVTKGSPAEKAGLQAYDIVISFDKQKIYAPEQLVKLVRNEKTGSEVKISYVRGGKLHETTAKLGEIAAREPVRTRTSFRLPFIDRFLKSGESEKGNQEEAQETQQPTKTPWATFKSLTITKFADNRYRAEIEYRDKDQKALQRKYEGTREEIKKAIEADKDLPADERTHLLRSIDQQSPFELIGPRALRSFDDWERELFTWPDLDF